MSSTEKTCPAQRAIQTFRAGEETEWEETSFQVSEGFPPDFWKRFLEIIPQTSAKQILKDLENGQFVEVRLNFEK